MKVTRVAAAAAAVLPPLLSGTGASAETASEAVPGVIGAPHPWETGLQISATPIKHMMSDFHSLLLVIITLITLFVLALLAYVVVRFNRNRNPVPTRTSHNTLLEVAWTVAPVVILVVIAVPSFKLLYAADRTSNAELTVKVVGHQWYWEYQYPDAGDVGFDSYLVPDSDLKPGQPRLLTVDNNLVVPAGTNIRFLLTGADVIHSWFVPSLGIQLHAVPGRVNETWGRVEQEGIYYGQCALICGTNHGFMPIAVEAVSKEKFTQFLEEKKKAARAEPGVRLAAAP